MARPTPQSRAILAWTTTPWTVPSNTGLAVHPELDVRRRWRAERPSTTSWPPPAQRRSSARSTEVVAHATKGADLVGWRYRRPLDLVVPAPDDLQNGWTVVAEDFVSADDGTGIVHMAPAFGADDYAGGPAARAADAQPDRPGRGSSSRTSGSWAGMFVKDADPVLVGELDQERDLLFDIGKSSSHSYPHCWRCDSPLLYVAHRLVVRRHVDAEGATCSPTTTRSPGTRPRWARSVSESGCAGTSTGHSRVTGTGARRCRCGCATPIPDHLHWIGSLAELAEAAGPLG